MTRDVIVDDVDVFIVVGYEQAICDGCHLRNDNSIMFKTYTELLEHMITHVNDGDDIDAVAFAYINRRFSAEGDTINRGDYDEDSDLLYDIIATQAMDD